MLRYLYYLRNLNTRYHQENPFDKCAKWALIYRYFIFEMYGTLWILVIQSWNFAERSVFTRYWRPVNSSWKQSLEETLPEKTTGYVFLLLTVLYSDRFLRDSKSSKRLPNLSQRLDLSINRSRQPLARFWTSWAFWKALLVFSWILTTIQSEQKCVHI